MKLCVVSDLHFEINGYLSPKKHLKDGGDVLILAGDLTSARFFNRSVINSEYNKRRKDIDKFLKNWASKFKHVLYILGNHEHYGCVITKTHDMVRESFRGTNVLILEDDYINIEGINFYGTTLWTSFNHADVLEMQIAMSFMNDYNWIFRKDPDLLEYSERHSSNKYVNSGRLLANNVLAINQESERKLWQFADDHKNERVVVISHHAPSLHCHNSGRHGDDLVHSYCNNYDVRLHQHENIELWIHGHTHDSTDLMINKTRIFSNQCGYIHYEPGARLFKPKFIDI